MAAPTSAAVSAALNIRLLPWLQNIRMGWGGVLVAPENTAVPGTKFPYMNFMGNCDIESGIDYKPDAKSYEFLQSGGNGVPHLMGKPLTRLDMMASCKINSASMFARQLFEFSPAATLVTQAAVASDVTVTISSLVLNEWYYIGVQQINQFVAYLTASPNTSYSGVASGGSATADYLLDTELGAVMFLGTGPSTLAAATPISYKYQAAAISNMPELLPGANARFTRGGVYIYQVFAANENRATPAVELRYMPFAIIEPTGNETNGANKPAELSFNFTPLQSNEISGAPYGFRLQINGTPWSVPQ
jgi:hypothetical protein